MTTKTDALNKYEQFKQTREKGINGFPMFFAFSNKQFEEGREKFGSPALSELLSIGAGGYILKKDLEAFKYLLGIDNKALKLFLKDPEQFEDAVTYELGNHEYMITMDEAETLDALNLKADKLTRWQRETLDKAKRECVNNYCEGSKP